MKLGNVWKGRSDMLTADVNKVQSMLFRPSSDDVTDVSGVIRFRFFDARKIRVPSSVSGPGIGATDGNGNMTAG